jgi:hypothetical protein
MGSPPSPEKIPKGGESDDQKMESFKSLAKGLFEVSKPEYDELQRAQDLKKQERARGSS